MCTGNREKGTPWFALRNLQVWNREIEEFLDRKEHVQNPNQVRGVYLWEIKSFKMLEHKAEVWPCRIACLDDNRIQESVEQGSGKVRRFRKISQRGVKSGLEGRGQVIMREQQPVYAMMEAM